MERLCDRLKRLRQEKRLRQDQVAALVGVTKSTVSTWESDVRQPSYQVLIQLANLYHVSTDYLLGRSHDRIIDLSGLTDSEVALIAELVSSMKVKNKKLEELHK